VRDVKEVPIYLTGVERIHLLLFYNDIDKRVSASYRLDGVSGDPFTRVEAPLRGTLCSDADEAVIGIGAGARISR
jgi:hypothetical protein